jgi:hypothetical protein
MSLIRLVAGALLLVALGVGAAKVTCDATTFPPPVPCNAAALSTPYTGDLKVDSVDSFGCVGNWAYLWATVGKGVQEIGVTEVLHYDDSSMTWQNASREKYCGHHLIPAYVDFWGCNSN